MVNRREVLIKGGVIGAGLVAADFSILDAFAGPTPPKRVSLQGLAWNNPIVETYRDGVDAMQKLGAGNVFNWSNLAHIHGKNQSQYHFCPHRNWYFLPWHRAYVVTYEKAIRKLTGNNNFAMPYWDWTTNPLMPDQFLNAKLPNNKPNALYVSGTMARTWPNNKPMPDAQVGPKVYEKILKSSPFEVFGTSRPQGQNSTAQSWIITSTGFQGPLEQTPHNNVHNNIGGWMPTALSPMDPIFFMHHANIDRIWAVWNHDGNANSSDSLWTTMKFDKNFYNPDGTPWSPVVNQLYVPEDLGYTYGLGPKLVLAAKNLVLIENKLVQLIKYLKNPGGPIEGVKVFGLSGAAIKASAPQGHLALPVATEAGLVGKVRARPQALRSTGHFRADADAAAPGTHVYAFISQVDASAPSTAHFRVFLNADKPDANTPTSDPHYVGEFAIFNHGMKMDDHSMPAPSFMLDLTDTLAAVGGTGASAATLNVQIVPVPNLPGADAGTVNAGSIQIAFVTP